MFDLLYIKNPAVVHFKSMSNVWIACFRTIILVVRCENWSWKSAKTSVILMSDSEARKAQGNHKTPQMERLSAFYSRVNWYINKGRWLRNEFCFVYCPILICPPKCFLTCLLKNTLIFFLRRNSISVVYKFPAGWRFSQPVTLTLF